MELAEENVVAQRLRRSVEDGEPVMRHEGRSVKSIRGTGALVGKSRAWGSTTKGVC